MLTSVQQEETEFRYLSLALNDQIKYWAILLSSIEPMQILTYEFIKASTVMKDGKQKLNESARNRLHSLPTERFHPVLQKNALVSISHTNNPPMRDEMSAWLSSISLTKQQQQKKNTNNKFPSICFWNSDAEGKRTPASVKEPIKCPGQQEVQLQRAQSSFFCSLGLKSVQKPLAAWTGAAAEACVVWVEVLLGEVLDADQQTP